MLNIVLPILLLIVISVLLYKRFKSRGVQRNYSMDEDLVILEIQVPKTEQDDAEPNSQLSALATEHLFASLHGLLKADPNMQDHFSFEVAAGAVGIKFYVTAPLSTIKFVESQVYAQYPAAQLRVVDDYVRAEVLTHAHYDVGVFSLSKDYHFPIKVFRDFEVDPLSNVVSVLSEVRENEGIWFQFLIKPLPDGWQDLGHSHIAMLTEGKSVGGFFFGGSLIGDIFREILSILVGIPTALFQPPEGMGRSTSSYEAPTDIKLTTFQELEVQAIENKLSKMGFEVVVRIVAYSDDPGRVDTNLNSVSAAFKQFSQAGLNELMVDIAEDPDYEIGRFKRREFDPVHNMILSNEEVATIFHLPTSREAAPNVSWVYSKVGEPPSNLPVEDCIYMGETLYRGKKVRFGLHNGDDRLRHMYLIGKTGTGKSTLLETMATQDIANGEGVGILDPHGETIERILDRIPDYRMDDVVIFDPSDYERPVGLNLLEMRDPSQKNLMASALVSAIKHHFDFSWGPRLEYLLNYSILTLLEVEGTSMLGITRLLEDKNYQNYILHQVKDPVVKKFWEREYKEMKGNQKLVTEAIAPIQNKVNRFLASTTIRNILGQRHSTIDMWDIMQSGKILLINLTKGKIGADNANLLGALLVSRIQFMALQRASIPYDKRKPFYLYVDEFQNFATGSFEEILSESRKYKLGLYLTHQYTAQLPEELLDAVYGNVGTIATFSLGAPDANVLSNEFAPYFDQEDIISLERFHLYVKLMIDGMTSLPFSAKILLPWVEETSIVPKTNNRDKLYEMSRQKYGVDRTYVEDRISRWVERPFDKGTAIAEGHKSNAKKVSKIQQKDGQPKESQRKVEQTARVDDDEHVEINVELE